MHVCVCVCVRERERERTNEVESKLNCLFFQINMKNLYHFVDTRELIL